MNLHNVNCIISQEHIKTDFHQFQKQIASLVFHMKVTSFHLGMLNNRGNITAIVL